MRIIGQSEMLRRAQEYVRDEPSWENILAEERRGSLYLYEYVIPQDARVWQGYYAAWARVGLADALTSTYIVGYYRHNGRWQDIDVSGHLEECVQAIKDNVYDLFF